MKKPIVAIAIVIFAARLQAAVTFDGEGKSANIGGGELDPGAYAADELPAAA